MRREAGGWGPRVRASDHPADAGALPSRTWLDIFTNGVRMLARTADGRMWTSFDGRVWTKLAGSAPLSTNSDNVRGAVTVMPRGIFYDDWKHGYVVYGAAE